MKVDPVAVDFPDGMDWYVVACYSFFTTANLRKALAVGIIPVGSLLRNRRGDFFFTRNGAGFKVEIVPEKRLKIFRTN
jgi:hypothetical protein